MSQWRLLDDYGSVRLRGRSLAKDVTFSFSLTDCGLTAQAAVSVADKRSQVYADLSPCPRVHRLCPHAQLLSRATVVSHLVTGWYYLKEAKFPRV